MALRDFIDSRGTAWTAWDIPPTRPFTPSREGPDRRVQARSGYSPERRSGSERRRRRIPEQLLHGWVCFESDLEKRRLIPPPPEWESASASELEELLGQAVPHPKLRLSRDHDVAPLQRDPD